MINLRGEQIADPSYRSEASMIQQSENSLGLNQELAPGHKTSMSNTSVMQRRLNK